MFGRVVSHMGLCVYWRLVLFQPSRAWPCPGTLAVGGRLRPHVRTMRKQSQQNFDWKLLGEFTGLGKLKGLGRASSRRQARKVRVRFA